MMKDFLDVACSACCSNTGLTKNIISLTNSCLRLERRHPLLRAALEQVAATYDPGCWVCIGPRLLTAMARCLAR